MLYDGKVLRPDEPLDLQPNAYYEVIIGTSQAAEQAPLDRPLWRYAALAQDLGIDDLAAQHDHYLYGTPKR